MSSLVATLRARIDTPGRRKFIRYSLVSVVSIVVTVTTQAISFGLLNVSAGRSAIIASTVAAVPSYYLNRSWVWKKGGRSHMRKEVLPFWIMAAIGLAVSTYASTVAGAIGERVTESHALRTFMVTSGSVLAFAVLWVVKYIIFNRILFAHQEENLDPALDGRSGLPT